MYEVETRYAVRLTTYGGQPWEDGWIRNEEGEIALFSRGIATEVVYDYRTRNPEGNYLVEKIRIGVMCDRCESSEHATQLKATFNSCVEFERCKERQQAVASAPRPLCGTSFSDRELHTWRELRRASDAEVYEWAQKHGVSGTTAAVALSGEVLALRQIARRLLDDGDSPDLRAEAERVLGFNRTPSQR